MTTDDFAALIERHQDDVYAVALATVGDHALAEDVAQETFIAAYDHRATLRDPGAIGGWLAAIARNTGRDLLRRRNRERLAAAIEDLADASVLPADVVDESRVRALVNGALARVPAKYREVLVLYYGYERSIDAIAQALGLTRANAMQRLSRGRKLVANERELRELGRERRLRAGFAASVLALLMMRGTASAAARRTSGARVLAGRALVLVGLVAIGGTRHAASSERDVDAHVQHEAAVAVEREVDRAWSVEHEVGRAVEPDAVVERAVRRRMTTRHARDLEARSSTPTTLERPRKPLAIVDVEFEQPAVAAAVPCDCAPPKRVERKPIRWELTNGFLETAELPARGELLYETLPTGMQLRLGVHRHVAVHAGIVMMDVERGAYRNAGTAFGGGIKLGFAPSKNTRLAMVVEGAREVNVTQLETRPGWLGRAYGAFTIGRRNDYVTLTGGVTGIDNGDPQWISPTFSVATHLGYDDRLGVMLESQYFTTSRDGTSSTHVAAVRYRNHHENAMLGIDRVKIDAGILVLERDNDEILPWVQVALGW